MNCPSCKGYGGEYKILNGEVFWESCSFCNEHGTVGIIRFVGYIWMMIFGLV